MFLTTEQQNELAARAAFLKERLQGKTILKGPAAESARQINRWMQKAGGNGGKAAFAKRLTAEDITLEQAETLTGAVIWNTKYPLPAWVREIETIFHFFPASGSEIQGVQCFEEEQEKDKTYTLSPLSFSPCFSPFIAYAAQKLAVRLGSRVADFTGNALHHLYDGLLKILSSLCFNTLLYKFSTSFLKKNPLYCFLEMKPSEKEYRKHLHTFTNEMLEGEWKEHLMEYPVLARLLVTAVTNWVEAIRELVKFLEQDRVKLENKFNNSRPLGQIIRVEDNLSDFHQQGRCVKALTLSVFRKSPG